MRGKNRGWTPEEDAVVLRGGKIAGCTPLMIAQRRYKLKRRMKTSAAFAGGRLLELLEGLRIIGKEPKVADEKFMRSLEIVVAALDEKKLEQNAAGESRLCFCKQKITKIFAFTYCIYGN